MSARCTRKRAKRNSVPPTPDLFTWAEDSRLNVSPAIARIMRRARVSAAVAMVISELSGYGTEAAHG
jgi:hypothetical protein